MSEFIFSGKTDIFYSPQIDSEPYQYAIEEIERLLAKAGITVQKHKCELPEGMFLLKIGSVAGSVKELPDNLVWDAYRIQVAEDGILLDSPSGKGILNGVYDLAERLGYRFLLPGDDGEWAPEKLNDLNVGENIVNPRFPYRGVFWQPLKTKDFSTEEWLKFYAKLRFNALRHEYYQDLGLANKLGLRFEAGGHGLSHLLPRDKFDDEPDLFRMFQPQDFGGKRMKDSNLCVSNYKTQEIVKENFKKVLDENKGVHAIHAWGDDLPAGGWCLCPSCRAFSPEDQAMLGMRLLSDVVEELDSPVRIPVIAYHDTMYPGTQIDAPKKGFLLFAPRERCYGHALDDPSCARNKFYLDALKAWTEKFKGIDDSHTFEYYFDQILFRGFYPFLPGVIIDDMRVYQEYGIECHMSLQVAGPEIAPEYNMLLFAEALWNGDMTTDSFCSWLTTEMAGGAAFKDFLIKRGEIYTDALRMCGHDLKVYLDYRWLPETTSKFGEEIAEAYLRAYEGLNKIADELESAVNSDWPEREKDLAEKEIKRARFEAMELYSMHFQQQGMNCFARKLNGGGVEEAQKGCEYLEKAIDALAGAKEKALEFGIPENSWYYGNINKWISGEFRLKIENYRGFSS